MILIHIDMDAFYAAVEVRDNPDLAGKPLIIGALPHERGVLIALPHYTTGALFKVSGTGFADSTNPSGIKSRRVCMRGRLKKF